MDNFASKLDEWFRYYDPNFLEVPETLKLIDFTNKRVLEIGSATSKSTMQACKKASSYFALDNDPRVIEFCKAKYHERNLEFILGSAESLPFESRSFDLVYLPWVFNYIKNKEGAVNEIFRVLKPNGKLILVDNSGNCDYDKILSGIMEYVKFDPQQAYEIPIAKKFRLEKKMGPFEVPYIFPSLQKALELMRFIVEDYLEIRLNEEKVQLLARNLSKYNQNDGKVIFHERPIFYLFSPLQKL